MKNTSLFAAIPLLLIGAAQAALPSREATTNTASCHAQLEANQGQNDAKVKTWRARAGYHIPQPRFRDIQASNDLTRPPSSAWTSWERIRPAGKWPQGKLPGIANYMIGAKRTTNIPTYAKIRSHTVYPGSTGLLRTQGQLEYDFVVAPGADSSRIRRRSGRDTGHCERIGHLVLPWVATNPFSQAGVAPRTSCES